VTDSGGSVHSVVCAPTVFISHAAEDIEIGREVKAACCAVRVDCFMYEDQWTGLYPITLPERIQAADFFLMIWSKDARTALDLSTVDWRFDHGSPGTDPEERRISDAHFADFQPAALNSLDRTLRDHAEEALADLHNREALARKEEDERALAELYGLESQVLCLSERWNDALQILRQQSPIIMRLGERYALEENCGRQAIALRKLGSGRDAAIALDQQAALVGTLQFEEDLGYAHWNWGLLAARRGDYDAAAVYLNEARALLESLGRPEEAGELDGEVEAVFGEALRSFTTTGPERHGAGVGE
jgi:tetratricopeptide (TPR) repeat protein